MSLASNIILYLKQSIALLIIDKGVVFIMQGIALLATQYVPVLAPQSSQLLSILIIINFLTQMLTNSAIVYRLYALTQGNSPKFITCYQQSFRQTPKLIGALLGCALVLIPTFVLIQLFLTPIISLTGLSSLLPLMQILLGILLMISFIYFTCFLNILIIAEGKRPIAALGENRTLMKSHVSTGLLSFIGILYATPLCLLASFPLEQHKLMMAFLIQLWIIIWHSFCIVIFDKFKSQEPKNRSHNADMLIL